MTSPFLHILASTVLAGTPIQPWETWKDLERLAHLETDAQSMLRSSYCLDGCRFDRSSEGDTRFIRTEGDEAVVFEATGPGAITRIWMTSRASFGNPIAIPAAIQMRVYLDNAPDPVLDMPLQAVFDGSTTPFLPPLVGDNLASSGGFFSYVPIPYAEGAKITLLHAETERLWYQFSHVQLPAGTPVDAFDVDSDLSLLAGRLASPSTSPWAALDRSSSAVTLAGTTTVYEDIGSGWLKEFRICGLSPPTLSNLDLEVMTDGTSFTLQARDFFISPADAQVTTQSMFVGTDDSDCLYSWFPMPYTNSAKIALHNNGPDQDVTIHLGISNTSPPTGTGRFNVAQTSSCPSSPPQDMVLLDISGSGKWVGLVSELSSWQTNIQDYLEGDERIHVDGALDPRLYGTGTEDIFNGGFYFFEGAFSTATHGAPWTATPGPDQDVVTAYRMMASDFVSFRSDLQVRLENGPLGDTPMCHKSTNFMYVNPAPGVTIVDQFLSGDGSHHQQPPPDNCIILSDFLGDEPPTAFSEQVCQVDRQLQFQFQPPRRDGLFLLRRFADVQALTPVLRIHINGRHVGTYPPMVANQARRWASQDAIFRLHDSTAQELTVLIESEDGSTFSSGRWELHAQFTDVVFDANFDGND